MWRPMISAISVSVSQWLGSDNRTPFRLRTSRNRRLISSAAALERSAIVYSFSPAMLLEPVNQIRHLVIRGRAIGGRVNAMLQKAI
jgi:hypothetical protein